MRLPLLFSIFCFSFLSYSQNDKRVSTMEFIQIRNNYKAEAIFYYQNNWKVLRDMAKDKGYIHSYQLLETPYSEEQPFHLILITTYANNNDYQLREDHFRELIEAKGGLMLMNDKKPETFRKSLFSKDMIKHIN